jgi:hypothetical protein
MFQTFWQFNRQNIRKLLDVAAGAITAYGAMYGEVGVIGGGILVALLNYAWFYIDNRNKVTVAGLEKAGRAAAAVDVEAAIKAMRKK